MRGLDRLRAGFYALKYRRIATFGSQVRIRGTFRLQGPGQITIGDRVIFDRFGGANEIWADVGGTVDVGSDSYINGLRAFADDRLSIGERGLIGECWITTSNFHSTRPDRHDPDAPVKSGPVEVEANVWLANRTVVLPSVKIGRDSVVACGTVVAEDVPEGVVVTGQQLRVVRRLDHRVP